MNCYIFDIHINCCFVADDLVEDEYKYDLLEVGPLNMIRSDVLKRVKTAVRSISSSPVPLNWWTEFSSWQDLRALHRTGSNLSIHRIVENLNRELEAIESVNAYIGTIDENGSIEIEISEEHGDILQAFTIRASRKRLRRLKEVAAYNVAQHLNCDEEVDILQIPNSLKKLVRQFVIKFSGDYIFDLNEN